MKKVDEIHAPLGEGFHAVGLRQMGFRSEQTPLFDFSEHPPTLDRIQDPIG